jgi:hypothetical protein
MSIIACPECKKKISSKASICSFCGYQLGEVTEADLEVFRARRLRDRIYRLNMSSYAVITVRLNMSSYAVITVFVAAFCWYWWDSRGFSQASSIGPFVLMGLSAVAYLVVRALLFRCRQQRKAMRAKQQMSSELRRNL